MDLWKDEQIKREPWLSLSQETATLLNLLCVRFFGRYSTSKPACHKCVGLVPLFADKDQFRDQLKSCGKINLDKCVDGSV